MHLIIAEKHDAAKRIAHILAKSKPKSTRVSGVEAFRFDDKIVVGLSGHVLAWTILLATTTGRRSTARI
jgi:DNA topoisomerase-1